MRQCPWRTLLVHMSMCPIPLPMTMAVQHLVLQLLCVSVKVGVTLTSCTRACTQPSLLCVGMATGVPGKPQSLMVNSSGDCQYPQSNSVINAEWKAPEGF